MMPLEDEKWWAHHNFRRELFQIKCIDELSFLYGHEALSLDTVCRLYRTKFFEGRPQLIVVPKKTLNLCATCLVTYREIEVFLGNGMTSILYDFT